VGGVLLFGCFEGVVGYWCSDLFGYFLVWLLFPLFSFAQCGMCELVFDAIFFCFLFGLIFCICVFWTSVSILSYLLFDSGYHLGSDIRGWLMYAANAKIRNEWISTVDILCLIYGLLMIREIHRLYYLVRWIRRFRHPWLFAELLWNELISVIVGT